MEKIRFEKSGTRRAFNELEGTPSAKFVKYESGGFTITGKWIDGTNEIILPDGVVIELTSMAADGWKVGSLCVKLKR